MKARTFGIVLVIGLVAGGLWLLIAFFLRPKPTSPAIVSVGGPGEQILGNDKLYFPHIVDGGKAVIGLTDMGTRFTRIDLTTNTDRALSTARILGATAISYAPDGSAAIVYAKQTDQPAVVTLYSFTNGTQTTLNPGISHIVWSNDSQKIYYLYSTDSGTSLAQADPTAAHFTILLTTVPYPDMELTLSPGGRYLTLTRNVLSGDLTQPDDHPLYIVDLKDNSLHKQPPTGIFDPQWAPSGNELAYLHYDPTSRTAHVAIYAVDTQTETPSTAVSLPGDFTWRSADELVVASPTSPTASDLINGFPATNATDVASVFANGKVTPLASIMASPAIDTLMVSPDGKTLYFRRLDYLRRVSLP